uniref:ATP synthase complex subunit 8 n=1 Tax=Ornithodoros zumpti TaxID=1827026 RepID=A0A1P8AGE7_9ACAR|nr:ATP synthase F0 subunit 8 [Ornithodoros zumpti]
MPQLFPMNWSILFMALMFVIFISYIILYFNSINNIPYAPQLSIYKTQTSWKW